MLKEDYIKIVKQKFKFKPKTKKIMIDQIENYYRVKGEYKSEKTHYHVGDIVLLKKGTLLHGTYKNIDGLKEIVKDGLISSWFTISRGSKYPSSVGVWNLKKDYLLKDYINFYSGGTVRYYNHLDEKSETEVIPFDHMYSFIEDFCSKNYLVWKMEQTKEARFLPSLVQDVVQIGIIINGNNPYIKQLLQGDVLNPDCISDEDVKDFVNKDYYHQFLVDRKNKDDFFTDRESAVLFGIPAALIEGVLVGRKYEQNKEMLKEIQTLLPNCYICNLDGKVISI